MSMNRWMHVYTHRKEKIPTLVARENDSSPPYHMLFGTQYMLIPSLSLALPASL